MVHTTERSQLQTQMGQEVIYLLLTSSMLGCVLLAAYVFLKMRSSTDCEKKGGQLNAVCVMPPGRNDGMGSTTSAPEPRKPPLDKPPIINIQTKETYFVQGSAEISAAFEEEIRKNILPDIIDRAKAYQANVIEIIGHTDGVPVGQKLRAKANLDSTISAFVEGQVYEAPVPHDNAGLGMARAVAVARLLKQSGIGQEYEMLPLSAGSLIAPDDRYSPGDVKESDQARRRIEIRLRQRHRSSP